MRARLVVALVSTVMLSVAACGSSDNNSAAGASSAVAPDLKGKDPLVIGMSTQDSGGRANRDYADGLEAWVERANSTTGIDGHPVKFERCDSKSLAPGEQQCSQKLASDSSVLAVSGMGGLVGTMSVPTYERAGIPMISVSMFVPQEYQTPVGVALNGGLISTYAVLMKHFQDEGAKTVSMLRVDVASAASVAEQYEGVADKLGLDWVGTTAVSPTATDVLPAVTQALSKKPDMLLTQTHPAQTKAILQAMETLGSDIPVLASGGQVTADVMESPAAADRLFYTSDFSDPTKSSLNVDDYAFLHEKFGSGLTDAHVLGFILGAGFKDAIEGGGGADATRASILKFVQTGTFKDLPWMPTAISRTDAPTAYPAVANLGAYVVKVDSKGAKSYVSDLITPTDY